MLVCIRWGFVVVVVRAILWQALTSSSELSAPSTAILSDGTDAPSASLALFLAMIAVWLYWLCFVCVSLSGRRDVRLTPPVRFSGAGSVCVSILGSLSFDLSTDFRRCVRDACLGRCHSTMPGGMTGQDCLSWKLYRNFLLRRKVAAAAGPREKSVVPLLACSTC